MQMLRERIKSRQAERMARLKNRTNVDRPELLGTSLGCVPAHHRAREAVFNLVTSVWFERFFGVLIEHYAGAFPAWLAPVQVRILPVAEVHDDYAHDVAARLRAAGFRTDVVGAVDPLGKRVRNGKVEKLPYVLVVGDDDVAAGTVAVNRRGEDRPERDLTVDDFIARLEDEVAKKA